MPPIGWFAPELTQTLIGKWRHLANLWKKKLGVNGDGLYHKIQHGCKVFECATKYMWVISQNAFLGGVRKSRFATFTETSRNKTVGGNGRGLCHKIQHYSLNAMRLRFIIIIIQKIIGTWQVETFSGPNKNKKHTCLTASDPLMTSADNLSNF